MRKLDFDSVRLEGKLIQKIIRDLVNDSDFSGNESLEQEYLFPKKFPAYWKKKYKR